MKANYTRYIIIVIIVFTSVRYSIGQGDPLYTQFMFNPFVINPAIAGTHNYYQVRSNNRFQWTGLPNSPITNTISLYGPLQKYPMGVGGYLYNDIWGAESKIGFMGSYAYNYPITPDIKASGGLHVGVIQYRIDPTIAYFGEDANNDVKASIIESHVVPDAAIGLYVYSSMFHVGFAATHLLPNKFELIQGSTGFEKLKTHFYLVGGYKYYINRDYAVEPSLIFRGVAPAPPQIDISVRGIYQNMLWLGFSFRSSDAISALVGYAYEDKIYFGYSFDFPISSISAIGSGYSHEIMVAYKFNSIKK